MRSLGSPALCCTLSASFWLTSRSRSASISSSRSPTVLEGDLDELIDALRERDVSQKLAESVP